MKKGGSLIEMLFWAILIITALFVILMNMIVYFWS